MSWKEALQFRQETEDFELVMGKRLMNRCFFANNIECVAGFTQQLVNLADPGDPA